MKSINLTIPYVLSIKKRMLVNGKTFEIVTIGYGKKNVVEITAELKGWKRAGRGLRRRQNERQI